MKLFSTRLIDSVAPVQLTSESMPKGLPHQPFAMKRLLLIAALLTAAVPAHAARYDFGQGAAAVACVMLYSGYSQRQVYAVLDTLESQIVRGGSTTEREERQMVKGFNFQARNNHNNCPLRIRY